MDNACFSALTDADRTEWLAQYGSEPTEADAGLGTIGSGNHFAEVQDSQEVHDEAAFSDLYLLKLSLVVPAPSGSRGLGEPLLQNHVEKYGAEGLPANTEEAAR